MSPQYHAVVEVGQGTWTHALGVGEYHSANAGRTHRPGPARSCVVANVDKLKEALAQGVVEGNLAGKGV